MEYSPSYKRQITKFGFYGFFKNLRFFDPVLLIYLASNQISTFQIGLLYSIRELIIYVFEVPSGVFADRYGKKTELILCFIFYIISFFIFAIGTTFGVFIIAMILFGLGEAFRSGTHKAMILLYLDQHNRSDEKSKTYGKTRSFSMIGSMISSLFTIYLVIAIPELKFLFFLAIIPYLMDILLILSYPNELNDKRSDTFTMREFAYETKETLRYVMHDKPMRRILLRSSSYMAGFKILKDFIQLILVSIPLTILLFEGFSAAEHVEIYAAIMYAIIFFISAISSRYAYLLLRFSNHDFLTNLMWILSGVVSIMIGLFVANILVVFIGFILLYVLLNIRKPLMVEIIGDHADPARRASVLSIDSQLTSIFIIVFAPILGYLSDQFSFGVTFLLVGIVMVSIYLFSQFQRTSRV
ncbi:MFS transporter [Candidatus Xianfuyuplasma coldseepsis]|uniref:MFS transporter n=1 Tax=Candidatus Xianfuyuplasma coldseepsis TaxID=2782163 RepID=A0A7L7KPT8_9MOLU|nr:MFS transporter [Xianfuyuplasma coldseepsis]QMS84585.1 MFS transporter [Xianfuyuplasma coldseepsis]